MKNINVLKLKNLRYMTIMLGFFITGHLLRLIAQEEIIITQKNFLENKKDEKDEKEFFATKKFFHKRKVSEFEFSKERIFEAGDVWVKELMAKPAAGEQSEGNILNYLFDTIWKCGFAFMLGSLISERRFLLMGKI